MVVKTRSSIAMDRLKSSDQGTFRVAATTSLLTVTVHFSGELFNSFISATFPTSSPLPNRLTQKLKIPETLLGAPSRVRIDPVVDGKRDSRSRGETLNDVCIWRGEGDTQKAD